MKKMIMVFSLIFIVLFSLFGCDNASSSIKKMVEGNKFAISSYEIEYANDISEEEKNSAKSWLDSLVDRNFYIEFGKDGTYTSTVDDESVDGTYQFEEETIIITDAGRSIVLHAENNKLVVEIPSDVLDMLGDSVVKLNFIFEKVK